MRDVTAEMLAIMMRDHNISVHNSTDGRSLDSDSSNNNVEKQAKAKSGFRAWLSRKFKKVGGFFVETFNGCLRGAGLIA